MEYIYNFNGKRLALNEFKKDIINDYVNTNKTKKDLIKIYPVGVVTLGRILKGIKKEYCECSICGVDNISEFYKTNRSVCKKCISKISGDKYRNLSVGDKKLYINKQIKWGSNNLIKIRVLAAKHRAKKKKIAFDIDEAFINELLVKQNGLCKYSGVLLDINSIGGVKTQMNINSLSIDRINSDKGYTKDNVVLVSAIVNTMKSDLTEKEFLSVINNICKTIDLSIY